MVRFTVTGKTYIIILSCYSSTNPTYETHFIMFYDGPCPTYYQTQVHIISRHLNTQIAKVRNSNSVCTSCKTGRINCNDFTRENACHLNNIFQKREGDLLK